MRLSLKIYRFFLILLILWSQNAWFTWCFDSLKVIGYIVYILFFIVAFKYKEKAKIRIIIDEKRLMAIFVLVIGLLLSMDSIKSIISNVVVYLPLLVLASDKEKCKEHIEVLSKALGIIVAVGIIPYLLHLNDSLGYTGRTIMYGSYESFENYFLFITPSFSLDALRYQSVFLEPGHLGTLCAFFLFINNYNLKKYYNIFFLTALVFSLSLAGYVLTVIGYFFSLIINKRKLFAPLLVIGVVITALTFATTLFDEESDFNALIIERLKLDDDKGIAGNDRFSEETDKLFASSVSSGDIWFGMGTEEFFSKKLDGSGFKIYILHHGIIAYILIWLFYWIEATNSINRKKAICMCILLYLSFLKSTNPCTYFWFIIFYLYINETTNIVSYPPKIE